ncbi:MAG: aminotransferase class V-fold PLP-dependent enzyme [Chloroflexi bacterium]|nr:aminotransferase class V-fold PLP-dependent enzyme [Chloroflexota bacterium]
MNSEEFRQHGYQVIDWIADYMENVEEYPVLSRVKPGDVRAGLPAAAPEEGEPFERILKDVDEIIMPGVTHWQSPNFFGYFPGNTSGPSILGELLSAGLGVQGMMWVTSPACTELETHVLDWLAEMVGLPEKFKSTATGGGVIQATASSGSLVAAVAAREQATGGRSNEAGVSDGLTAYTSAEAHSSIEKAVRIAGIGSANLRKIETDETFAMRPAALAQAIRDDKVAGRTPVLVCATVGTTSSTAIDPVPEIGRICAEHGVWLHVDAAMAGTAALCPEFRFLHEGLEFADSYLFNPHKWMLTNVDCSAFYVADRRKLTAAMSVVPEYLRNVASESGEVIDYRDWQVELGRRFRSLKLWFVIRSYGVKALREIVRGHVAMAQEFAAWVEDDPDFEVAAPVLLSLVCFRHRGGDEVNQEIMDRVNEAGRMFMTHTKLDGKLTLRLSIGQETTGRKHVERAWETIRKAAGAIA